MILASSNRSGSAVALYPLITHVCAPRHAMRITGAPVSLMARAASSNASWRRLKARISYLAPYASRASTIAPGPQPPFRLSRRLSHSRERFTSSCWNFSVLSARPSAVSVIWTPAGAHQSFVSCVMKADFGFFTTRSATGFLRGVGVGVGVGWMLGLGATPPGVSGVRLGVGDGSGVGGTSAIGRGVEKIVGAVGRSGGGSTMRSIRWRRLANRSPAPKAFV